jgi:hypothetical protein
MKKAIIPILTLILLSCVPTTQQTQSTIDKIVFNPNIYMAGGNLILENLVRPLICDSVCDHHRSWNIVQKSLQEFVLPALHAKDPQIVDLNKWIELLINEGIDENVATLLSETINILLTFIPTEDLDKYYTQNEKVEFFVIILRSWTETFTRIITDCQLHAIVEVEVSG